MMDELTRVYGDEMLSRMEYRLFHSEDGPIDRSAWDEFGKFYILNRVAGLEDVRKSGIALFVEDER